MTMSQPAAALSLVFSMLAMVMTPEQRVEAAKRLRKVAQTTKDRTSQRFLEDVAEALESNPRAYDASAYDEWFE